ncbi:cutinase [Diaporthe amygdali]|uniref:cutinase n=1 Tax=Phomopsis amygdali TaxID=1214568 RepID=UPI0022FE30D6|nr:cutinase [Diaporthe amygdali]KAJ0119566.1 cutinase [Diaporthe amygdali]
MRLLSPSRLILPAVLLASSHLHLGLAAPAPVHHDERDLSAAVGNLLDDFADLVNDTASLLSEFVTVIKELKNATNENDLIGLLGVNVTGSDNDDNDKANGTVSAVAANGTVTCPDMAVLFARGTAELGNVGLYTGPSFFTALRNYINGTSTMAVQGVPYPASIPGFLAGGSPFGSGVMAALANKTASACPNTKIIMSGYSQGAQVVHNAMQKVAAMSNSTAANNTNVNVASKVSSVVLFGDPRNGTAVAGVDQARVLSLCNAQDDICAKGGDVITLDHLTYNRNAPQAAMFVMQKSALGLMSNDAMMQGMGNVPVVQAAKGQNGGQQVGTGLGLPGM